ncbi:hypothetical protein BpHYR1_017875 [Brachionus plicatilis]|uniref:Uncharacterized protein n=1 Tax=Brachionus plicatilis TaxID=10195 RepID=A0A3M7RLS8_BRAPC|nr:hypothetical protein BpHYR1_017875 [Brachionus plicatilis]
MSRSHRIVSGSLHQGPKRNISQTTLNFEIKLYCLVVGTRCFSLKDFSGFCQAHSKRNADISFGNPCIIRTISHGPLPLVLLAPPFAYPELQKCKVLLSERLTVKPQESTSRFNQLQYEIK